MIQPNFNIKPRIRKGLVDKLYINDIGSLSAESFTDIIKKDTIVYKTNPQIKIEDLEEYLSGESLLFMRVLRLINYLIFISAIIISFVYSNYLYLISIPFIIFISISPRPFNYRSFHYFNFMLIVILLFWGFKIPLIGYLGAIILVMRVVKLFEIQLINKNLLPKILLNENIFKTLYLRNILIISDGQQILNSDEEANELINKIKTKYPSDLTHDERLYYCKQCINKGFDIKEGIICNLTKEKPNFKFKCEEFQVNKIIEARIKNEYSEKRKSIKESIETINFGSNVLYLISGLILFSNSYFFINQKFISAISSGMLEFLNLKLSFYEYYVGIILSIIFLGFGLLSKFRLRIGFILGIGLYGLDSVLSLISQNYYSIWIHFVLLIWIGYSLKQLNDSKEYKSQELEFTDE